MRLVNPLRWLVPAVIVLTSGTTGSPAETRMVMVEQAGCAYCARWNAEVGPIWPKTPEGQAAPLRRIDLHGALPKDLHISRPVVFTPTFILTRDGTEVGRIEGYTGDEIFWWMVNTVFTNAGVLPTP